MDNHKKGKNQKSGKNPAPAVDNDQLGENVSLDPDALKRDKSKKRSK